MPDARPELDQSPLFQQSVIPAELGKQRVDGKADQQNGGNQEAG
jgi:hypothetical protein